MFGIEVVEILSISRQIGIAIIGAAAFWGIIFLWISKKSKDDRVSALWQGAAQKLLWIFFPALFFYGIAWVILAIQQCAFCASAHEGISYVQEVSKMPLEMTGQFPLFFSLMFVGFIIGGLLLFAKRTIFAHLFWVYTFFLLLVSFIVIYPWTGVESIGIGVSRGLHGWHSILTLGSVVVVDFLYIALRYNLKQLLPKIFIMVSFGIWVGLGLDFLSSGIVFGDEFSLTDKTLFMQTLIGIIIINGVLLSGPFTQAILSFQRRIHAEVVSVGFHRLICISGSISLASWIAVTALDGFRSLTLAYWQLLIFYIVFIAFIYISREVLDKLLITYKEN